MKNKIAYSIVALVSVVALVVGFVGWKLPQVTRVIQQVAGAYGETNNGARLTSCVLDFSTTTPTTATTTNTACLTNNDGRDRIITELDLNGYNINSNFGYGNGGNAGLATGGLQWTVSTSTSLTASTTSSNFLMNFYPATTSAPTGLFFLASTSPGAVGGTTYLSTTTRIWATGTNINMTQNGTSSTAAGTLVIKYYESNQ